MKKDISDYYTYLLMALFLIFPHSIWSYESKGAMFATIQTGLLSAAIALPLRYMFRKIGPGSLKAVILFCFLISFSWATVGGLKGMEVHGVSGMTYVILVTFQFGIPLIIILLPLALLARWIIERRPGKEPKNN